MGCLMECWDMGPPPDSILFLPPPPMPAFLQQSGPDLLLNTTPCSSTQLCESWLPVNNKVADDSNYVEMPRKDIETWAVSSIDDTWLLVLVASSIGVLLLGALLAMFLLKCREMNLFGTSECSLHVRDLRHHKSEPRDCASLNLGPTTKLMHPSEPVLYHGTNGVPDNRMVWAALTPRGTQHFISENYPRDLVDYAETEDHYETVDYMQPVLTHSGYSTYSSKDYDYEDPAPLIEISKSLSGSNRDVAQYSLLENTDMRCASLGLGSLRRGVPMGFTIRPRVSSPTRIEHPNLPPLNLYPRNKGSSTLKRDSIGYRGSENGTLPKYAC